ncbi:MAG: lipopolysaccharide biosynthesis protein [Rhodothermales bacterium]|nr:lipopolysaccharide biosynthesis protein [Rhodothermales bacterium]
MTDSDSYKSVRARFVRPVALLLSGSGTAFLIGYLARPLVMRLFPVEAFGVYEFILTLVAVAIPVASLRYEDAIVLPESREEARDVWMLSLLLTLASVGLATLGVLFLGHLVPDPETRRWLWAAPALLLVLRLSKLFELWLTREKAFGTLSTGSVTQRSVTTAGHVGIGLSSTSAAGGLLAGFGAGHLAAALLYATRALKTLPVRARLHLRTPASRYRRFAQYASPAALVSALATRLPFLVLLGVFGAEFLGWFGQAFHVLYVPLSLLGVAVGQVFFVEAAEAWRRGSLKEETRRIHDALVTFALVPLAGVCAAGPDLFAFFFGDAWRTAGEFAVYLAPWIALTAVGSPLTRVFDVMERQRLDLAVNIAMFSLVGAALLYVVQGTTPLEAVIVLGIVGALSRAIQVAAALRCAGVAPGETVRAYLRPLAEAALVFVLVSLLQRFFGPAVTSLGFLAILLVWLPFTYRRLVR